MTSTAQDRTGPPLDAPEACCQPAAGAVLDTAAAERLAAVLVVVGAAGSFLGTRLTSKFVSGPTLKRIFGILIVVMTAIKLITLLTA